MERVRQTDKKELGQDTQFVIRTLAGELCEAFADGKEEQKNGGRIFYFCRPSAG